MLVDYRTLGDAARLLATGDLAEAGDVRAKSYAGDLLPGWYDDWLIASRGRWKEIRLQALDAIARCHINERRFLAAIEAALTAATIEPLRETTRHLLIHAYIAEGNRAQALREYRSFCQYLDSELGIIPSADLVGLVTTTGLVS